MGNCCATESSMDWGGDDWDSLTSRREKRRVSSRKVFDEVDGVSLRNLEKEKLLGVLRASSDANGKVKIKISKKELQELLGKEKKQGGDEGHTHAHASAEQVLARLIHARDNEHHHDAHHRPWRPMLKSIPEVN